MASKKRTGIIILIIFLVCYVVVSGVLSLQVLVERNPVLPEKINKGDTGYLYSFYVKAQPMIDERPFYGDPEADITIIAVLDHDSAESSKFMDNIFPTLDENYIKNGKVKMYVKYFLDLNDIAEKSNRYIYAKSLECVRNIDEEKYFDYYFGLLNNSPVKDLNRFVKTMEIDPDAFISCMENDEFDVIPVDAIENENYGNGLGQRFYIGLNGNDNTIINGIPDFERFRIVLRNLQLMIGEEI